jgi:hypothetical protein
VSARRGLQRARPSTVGVRFVAARARRVAMARAAQAQTYAAMATSVAAVALFAAPRAAMGSRRPAAVQAQACSVAVAFVASLLVHVAAREPLPLAVLQSRLATLTERVTEPPALLAVYNARYVCLSTSRVRRRGHCMETMTRYYHVVPGDYSEGECLYSYDALVSQDRDPGWKWEGQVRAEPNRVALFRHPAWAQSYRDRFGGTICAVYLPQDFERDHVRPNSEGEPSVADCIPGKYVSRWNEAERYP